MPSKAISQELLLIAICPFTTKNAMFVTPFFVFLRYVSLPCQGRYVCYYFIWGWLKFNFIDNIFNIEAKGTANDVMRNDISFNSSILAAIQRRKIHEVSCFKPEKQYMPCCVWSPDLKQRFNITKLTRVHWQFGPVISSPGSADEKREQFFF